MSAWRARVTGCSWRPPTGSASSCRTSSPGKGERMLVYSAIMSLDGYTTDADGNFEWSAPDEEVLAFLNDRERPIGIYLYGRLMYEVMHYWENVDLAGKSEAGGGFGAS